MGDEPSLAVRLLAGLALGVPLIVLSFATATTMGASIALSGLVAAGAGVVAGIIGQKFVKGPYDGD